MQLRHAARTDAGKTRDHNEDSFGVEIGGERAAAGALFVVCDGVGGFASGEVASELAVRTIIERYYGGDTADTAAALAAAFEVTNEAVFAEGSGKMGTTSVAAVFKDDAVTLANVGDCRAYLIRRGAPRQLTRDHSFVAEQVAAGMLTEDQARASSYRNIITRAIGHRPEIEVDTFREPLLKDDIVVLCSDGLHGQVTAAEIALAVTKVSLDDACQKLIRLANERGGPDNITVVAVEVTALTFATEDLADAPAAAEQPSATSRLEAKAAAPGAAPSTEAGGGTERLDVVYGPPPAVDRRKADRRVPAAPPPMPAQQGGGSLRALLIYALTALVLAAVIFGGYYVLTGSDRAAAPTPSPAVRPTLTPTGASAQASPAATLVPTPPSASP